MKEILTVAAAAALAAAIQPALAQSKSRIPPRAQYEAMLQGNREPGWIQFRNYDGRQIVYFTALQTLHCRLNEIRYSINSRALDQRLPLVKCNPQTPFSLPSDAPIGATALFLDAGTASTVAVQVVWEDGKESAVSVYEPCQDVGEQTCAWLLE